MLKKGDIFIQRDISKVLNIGKLMKRRKRTYISSLNLSKIVWGP